MVSQSWNKTITYHKFFISNGQGKKREPLIGAGWTRDRAHFHRRAGERGRKQFQVCSYRVGVRLLDYDSCRVIKASGFETRFPRTSAASPGHPLTDRCPTEGRRRCRPDWCFLFWTQPSAAATEMQLLIPTAASAFVSTAASLLALLLLLLCVIRKKRMMEGTYRPSAEERKQTGAAGPERPGLPLPLPKEERLI